MGRRRIFENDDSVQVQPPLPITSIRDLGKIVEWHGGQRTVWMRRAVEEAVESGEDPPHRAGPLPDSKPVPLRLCRGTYDRAYGAAGRCGHVRGDDDRAMPARWIRDVLVDRIAIEIKAMDKATGAVLKRMISESPEIKAEIARVMGSGDPQG